MRTLEIQCDIPDNQRMLLKIGIALYKIKERGSINPHWAKAKAALAAASGESEEGGEMSGEAKVKCRECVFATGYNPMYVGGDCRKWGTSICTRLKRRRRVDTLGGYDGCNKGVRKEKQND